MYRTNHLPITPLARILIVAVMGMIASANLTHAGSMRLGDVARVRGQETNTLQGLGLVVGLQGTGDGDLQPTSRALARMMQLMGADVSPDRLGRPDTSAVQDARNVALVFVTAKVPAVGAQQGDLVDVTVNAINAKSLEGGYLMVTPLLGPRNDDPNVYALAQGRIRLSPDSLTLTSGTVQQGAKMESTIMASFQERGSVTLVLNRDFAGFDAAQRIEDEINSLAALTIGGNVDATTRTVDRMTKAIAMDALHIRVDIPPLYQRNPVKFLSFLMNIPVQLNENSTRVVINESEGVVVIGADVEIAPVLVTHKNIRIEAVGLSASPGEDASRLVPLSVDSTLRSESPQNARLKHLADALNALDVPTRDLIAIIKTLKRKGDLFGEVIFQ
ncbi:MAG: flagellar basal body P-ring protein FlgI [Planctomycetota bacterium]